MEPKLKIKIEETVREILEESDMETTTENQIRKIASRKLELDLNKSEYKAFVRHVVNNFLEEQNAKEEQGHSKEPEFDDDGDLIVCRLSEKRKVTIQNFRGTTLVSIREFYKKDGKELPTSKGISLKEEQWSALKKNIPAIEEAIREMEDRL
ncbi:RNA polymerase II transcriptional coactivator KELP [Ricinus communis]|uniref:RNA polymerase II transcriptional coactivator kelp, putative n=1 Tax=Ricinus communis TaxID=3988 RepID=B9RCV7_RICCO|nr:RNA polymerase II transcriptional coactivator KELP [Ricinus communis]EEF51378.1 RNA polymerase II transcriptional coactivator kelp, putative [Ricinus communis]|eukprot:XP_002509991.1 RNA polymerase II transcriptional coactivator KELP [Ricinus communis]